MTKTVSKRKERKIENEADLDAATLQWKKDYSVFLKAADHSYRQMSDILGVTSRIVKSWYERDPEMFDRVSAVREDMTKGALNMLKRHAIEATEILLQSARGALRDGAWKEARDGSTEVLDRVGLSKVNKSESKVTKEEKTLHETAEGFFDKFEAMPHETQVQIAELMNKVEELVHEAKGSE